MKLYALLPLALLSLGAAQGRGGPGMPGPMGPPPGPPRLDAIREYLGLTDDQIQQIQRVRQDAIESNRTVAEPLREKERNLRALVESGTADAAAAGGLTLEIEALRTRMRDLADTVQQNVLALLSAEQLTRLGALQEAAKLRPAVDQASGLGLLGQGPPQGPPPEGPPAAGRPR
jgi:Spy/CpxP family protein refolding chaperone